MRDYSERDYRADLKFLRRYGVELSRPTLVSSPPGMTGAQRANAEADYARRLVREMATSMRAALSGAGES